MKEKLRIAQECWAKMAAYRQERERCKRYTYGRQWDDPVTIDGETMSEAEYIRRQGSVPLKNNLIRRLVRNVIGVYRSQAEQHRCVARDPEEQPLADVMTNVLQCNMQLNRMDEVYARTLEELLIGGLVAHRKSFGWRNDRVDCWTDYVSPTAFFVDSDMHDFRGWDAQYVGELHDLSFGELCARFAHTTADYKRLRDIYAEAADNDSLAATWHDFGGQGDFPASFFLPSRQGACRVVELWYKDRRPRLRCHDRRNGNAYKTELGDLAAIEAENAVRKKNGDPEITTEWFIDNLWRYALLSPTGHVIEEGETPYAHHSHPYVFLAYPFIDGEVHSFVSDVIDQQRYVNRLITLQDWMIRSSAKGVLLFPEECLPEYASAQDIADEWARYNGVIFLKTKNNTVMPQQVNASTANTGIAELLNMQLSFFEDISGVSDALQGKVAFAGTSAQLYNQQTQNAKLSLLDMLDSFRNFTTEAAYKDLKNIVQYYDEPRVFNIAGHQPDTLRRIIYDPLRMRDVEMDLRVES